MQVCFPLNFNLKFVKRAGRIEFGAFVKVTVAKMSSILNSILFLLVVSQLSDCHVHKHFKNEKTTVSQFENHQDHAEFDRDALFGSSNEHLNELPPEEAKKRLRRFIEDGKLDRNEDGYITKDELADWVLNSFQSISIQDAQDQLKEEDEDRGEFPDSVRRMVSAKRCWDSAIQHSVSRMCNQNFSLTFTNLQTVRLAGTSISKTISIWAPNKLPTRSR